ncbi:hypothetical protein RHSIM_Rhsim06G0129500 [Rhododendron simsii]|uniref:Uncharacterized protein n=1 Tax=Rhododendron simsii TaxID=118357 RepID=A0A834GUS1_RHOSS|nr:hypothetical protein RHSIM_Rhsim06G0129500 [Rhododendron simsii]
MVAGGSWAFYALGSGYVDGGCMMEVVWVSGDGTGALVAGLEIALQWRFDGSCFQLEIVRYSGDGTGALVAGLEIALQWRFDGSCFQLEIVRCREALFNSWYMATVIGSNPIKIFIFHKTPGLEIQGFKDQVLEFFNRLMIQRVSPKSYQQAIVEVYLTRKFVYNLRGELIRGHIIQYIYAKAYSQITDYCKKSTVNPYVLCILYFMVFKCSITKPVSTSYCSEVVESADAYVFVGPIFNDYSLVGYSLVIKKEKSVIVQPNRMTIVNGTSLGWVFMSDFLTALAKKLKNNNTAYENYC